jgi:hypothetical protein
LIYLKYPEIIQNAGLFFWLDLFNKGAVNCSQFHRPNSKDNIKENFFGEIIRDIILENEEVFLINPGVFSKYQIKNIGDDETTSDTDTEKPDLYSFRLFNFPHSFYLTKEQMIVIRNSFQRKINTIMDLLTDFKNEISNEDFNDIAKEKTNSIYEKIKPETAIFQKHIDNELYLQQIINSNENVFNLQLRAAVTSIENLTRFYETNGIMIPYLADALRKELALRTDLNKCRMILYWTFNG